MSFLRFTSTVLQSLQHKKIFMVNDRLDPFAVTNDHDGPSPGPESRHPPAQAASPRRARAGPPGPTATASTVSGRFPVQVLPPVRPSLPIPPPQLTRRDHITPPPTHNSCPSSIGARRPFIPLRHLLPQLLPSASPIPTRRLVLPQFPKPRLIPKGSWCSPPPRRLSQPPPPLPPAPPACAAAVALVVDELAS